MTLKTLRVSNEWIRFRDTHCTLLMLLFWTNKGKTNEWKRICTSTTSRFAVVPAISSYAHLFGLSGRLISKAHPWTRPIWVNIHCVSKTSHLWLAIVFKYTVRLRQFFAQMWPRKWAIKRYFIFPPQLISASALPVETGNPEIASFHLNAACFFTKKHEIQLKISPGQSWATLHCQNDRLGAPDRT